MKDWQKGCDLQKSADCFEKLQREVFYQKSVRKSFVQQVSAVNVLFTAIKTIVASVTPRKRNI